MFTLKFYFLTIISLVIFLNLVSTKTSQITPLADDVDEFPDNFYFDDPIDTNNSVIIIRKSNGIRTVSIHVNIFLLIGLIYSI